MDREIRFLKLANCFPSESLEKTWEKMINMEKEIATLKSELAFLSEELSKKYKQIEAYQEYTKKIISVIDGNTLCNDVLKKYIKEKFLNED